jgi:hypothetical protein
MILHRARSESNIRPVEGCPRQIVKDALVASFPGAQELETMRASLWALAVIAYVLLVAAGYIVSRAC